MEMDSKKRIRDDTGSELEHEGPTKKPKLATPHNLHHIAPRPMPQAESSTVSHLDTLITSADDIDPAHLSRNEQNSFTTNPANLARVTPALGPKKSLHTVGPSKQTATSSLFQSARSLEPHSELPPFSAALQPSWDVPEEESDSRPLITPASRTITSNASQQQEKPLLHVVRPAAPSSASLFVASRALLGSNGSIDGLESEKVDGFPLTSLGQGDLDDEFEAIIAAGKAKRALQTPRQLHQISTTSHVSSKTKPMESTGSKQTPVTETYQEED